MSHDSTPENDGPVDDATAADTATDADADADAAVTDGPEDTATPDAEDTPAAPSLEEQLAERTEDLQRVTAEYANYRRRVERDRVAVIATAKGSVVTQLLDVIDDLVLAEKHGDLTGPLKSVNDKIRGVFSKLDVAEIGAEGDAFDPERHEAVQDLSTGDTKVIGTVLRPGFVMGDKLIRTAMVIITDPATADDADTASDADAANAE